VTELTFFRVILDCSFDCESEEYQNNSGFISIKFVWAIDEGDAISRAKNRLKMQMKERDFSENALTKSIFNIEEVCKFSEFDAVIESEESFVYYMDL
jgi:hypothetical protein